MRGVAESFGELPLPEQLEDVPEVYSEAEAQTILSILRNEQQRLRAYEGDFAPPWLLNAFESLLWHTTNRGHEECIADRWQHTINIDWNVLLPNGARLGDAAYVRLLTTVKKLSVLRRSGYLGRVPAPAAWCSEVGEWLALCRWMVLHEARYQPATHGFWLLDQNGVNELLRLSAQGGWTEALQIPARLLSRWYAEAYGEECPPSYLNNPYAVPEDVCERLCDWLAAHSYYCRIDCGVYRGRHRLDIHRLARQVNASVLLLRGSEKVRLFCRQFEPDFSASPLLLSSEQRTEYPAHTVSVREELALQRATSDAPKLTRLAIESLLSAHRHLPAEVPNPMCLSMQRGSHPVETSAMGGHRPFIPINVGLSYLNEAMRWVHCYGEAVVDYYLATLSQLDFQRLRTLGRTRRLWKIRRAFDTVDAASFAVEGLQISGLYRSGRARAVDFAGARAQPTLTDALNVLIGACVVCIAILKPSREAELAHLPRECLREGHDGYYLRFQLGKSNAGEAYPWRDKPIPKITAQAIRLLQRLGTGVATALGSKYKHQQKLFCLPSAHVGETHVPTTTMLNNYLDLFCDWVALPPDVLGRRWYVRVHEMRKWFLLLLFWAGRFDVLDAARWIAGHVRADHTYAYIEQNFPGEELPAIEAEYSIDRLRRLDQTRRAQNPEWRESCDENPGLETLYERVCRQFNVASLAMVRETEWMDYVTTLRAENRFSLYPHSLYADDGERVVGITVSFVLAEDRA